MGENAPFFFNHHCPRDFPFYDPAGQEPGLLERGSLLDDPAQAMEENDGKGLSHGQQGGVRAAQGCEGDDHRELGVLP